MNKIIVDEENLIIDNEELELTINTKNLDIECKGDNKLIIKNNKTINLTINLEDNSSLKIYVFNKNKMGDNRIVINQSNNTSITYKEAFISSESTNELISNVIMGNNNKSDIIIRCISNNEDVNLDVLIVAIKDTINNVATQDIKGINNGGIIKMLPNMEISSNEVEANHYMTIGDIDKNFIFYLQSLGISYDKAKELILVGFLKSIFEELTGGEIIE